MKGSKGSMREALFSIVSGFWAGAVHAATPGYGKTIAAGIAWADTLLRVALRPAARDHGRSARFAAFLEGQGLIGPPAPVATYPRELPR